MARAADESFLAILRDQSKQLIKKDGWDRRAVFAYLEAIDARFGEFREDSLTEIPQETYLKELEDTFAEVHKVGSGVYTYMFEVSGLKAKEKAQLVISQMGGYMDGNEMLQLAGEYQFDSEMPPHAEFLESYAACVRTAWQKKSGSYKILDDQKVHQFECTSTGRIFSMCEVILPGRLIMKSCKIMRSSMSFLYIMGNLPDITIRFCAKADLKCRNMTRC